MPEMEKPSRYYRCSVARTLEILGDRWVFLILRELFFGVRYYDQFQSNLGIATNILSNRLKTLINNGILNKHKSPNDRRRFVYKLTEKGRDIYAISLAFMNWGDKWLAGDNGPPLILHHKTCGHQLEPVLTCKYCKKVVDPRDVTYEDHVDQC